MPTATPTPSRHSRYSTTTTDDDDNDISTLDTQLPPYEPPLAPLTAESQNALANLAQSHKLKALQTHITHAVEKLGDSAAQVNERLTDARERYTRYMARKRSRSQYENDGEGDENEGGEDEDDEEVQRIKRTEEQVHAITEKLESEMRGIVDTEVKAGGLISILADLGKEAEVASTTTQRQQPRNTRRRRNPNPDSDDEEDEQDEDYQETQPQSQQQAVEPPSQKLTHQLTTETTNWNTLSLTQRYSTNNTYIGFYRMVHDAKHPGDDIPPLPHASTWFRHLEDPSTTAASPPSQRPQTRRHQSTPAEDDEDIAIESERVSLKCPLTLLIFQEPLTSRKCPHSFEKQAILDMIVHSPMMVPGADGDRRNRVRAVKCPVCSVVLTQEDLKRDAVLERRVRRMQRQQEEDEDEDEDEDRRDGNRRKRSRAQRKSGITVASDDDDGDDDDNDDDDDDDDDEEAQPVRVKQEKAMSRAPSAL